MYQKKKEEDIRCPLEYVKGLLDGKWKTRILCELGNVGTLRYSELKSDMVGITDTVLSTTLCEMIADSLVEKESVKRDNAVFTFYSITRKGESLIPLLKAFCQWAETYSERTEPPLLRHCLHCSSFLEWRAL